jgi:predicted N-acetyltransferase YhbS
MNSPNKSKLNMIIRKETLAGVEAITEVTIAAFNNHPTSNHTEQFISKALANRLSTKVCPC